MRKVHIIVNPSAGGGRCMERYRLAKVVLQDRGLELWEQFSNRPGQIAELTQKAVEAGAQTILLVGGDGTLREALGSLVYQPVDVFLFPFGTGNDFARFAGIHTDPVLAAEQFLSSSPRPVDAAKANDQYFINVAGMGFDVQVLEKTKGFKRYFGDKWAYRLGLISALVHLRHCAIEVKTETMSKRKNSIILCAGNGAYIGGGIFGLPRANFQDGRLDICIVQELKPWRIPKVLGRFLKGRHLSLPEVEYFDTNRITITTKTPMAVELDGEILTQTPVEIQIQPQAVRLLL